MARSQETKLPLFAKPRSYRSASIGTYTQEDPIGLAGGLNLYGFANGDPINFSDPFGLCPEDLKKDAKACDDWNQSRAAEARSFYESEQARGNRGTKIGAQHPPVRGVNQEDVTLEANCRGGTWTGCTRVDRNGAPLEIVVNADRPGQGIASTLARESVHAGGLGMLWEGLAQFAGRLFVLELSMPDRIVAELAGGGPVPQLPVLPPGLIRIP